MSRPVHTDMTQDELKAQLHYDPETGFFTRRISHHGARAGERAGTLRHDVGYRLIYINGRLRLEARLAVLYMTGEWPKGVVDHINGIRTDNRWCNLRSVSQSENMQNVLRANANNKSSGLRGVTFYANLWRSQIRVNNKSIFLGYFKNKEDAHAAYLSAKQKLHVYSTREQ